jgi:antitoxin HigA-1
MLKKGMSPTHPGRILKNLYMEPLGLSQTDAAKNLGITRKTLSMLLNEHQGISAEMALRLAKVFDTTPELWLNLQRNYDLWNTEQKVDLSHIKMVHRNKSLPGENVKLKGKADSGNQHVTPRDNGWAVIGAGNSRATAIVSTKQEAIRIAKNIAKNQGGDVVIC